MTAYSINQWGRESGGAWITSLGLLVNNDYLGFSFDLSSGFDGGGNPPVYGTGFSIGGLVFTNVNQNWVSKNAGALYYVNQAAPSDFATANLPSALIAAGSVTTLQTFSTGDITAAGTTGFTLTETGFGFNVSVAGRLRALMAQGSWSGVVAFIIGPLSGVTGQVNYDASAATFTTTETPNHTGFDNYPMDRPARAVFDPKTGFPYMSDEFIEDGFREGLWVHPDSWDPPDEQDDHDYVPSPTEGEKPDPEVQ